MEIYLRQITEYIIQAEKHGGHIYVRVIMSAAKPSVVADVATPYHFGDTCTCMMHRALQKRKHRKFDSHIEKN